MTSRLSPCSTRPLEHADQQRHVVEVQPGGGFVEDQERALAVGVALAFDEVADEFQPLRLAAGERVERLPQAQVTQPDFLQNPQCRQRHD